MKHYAGIDVSLEASSVCVVDAEGRIIREAKVLSETDSLIAWFEGLAAPVDRIGLEAGPLSQWLHATMAQAGLAVELLETRHVRTAFKTMPVKTDKKDAGGIAQLMRLGWFRPVHCKSLPAQEVRAVLTARKLLQGKLHDVEMCIRGILRGFGLKVGPTTPRTYEARVRALTEGHPTLEAIATALLNARGVFAQELRGFDRRVRGLARDDERAPAADERPGRRRPGLPDLRLGHRRAGEIPILQDGGGPLRFNAKPVSIRRDRLLRPHFQDRRHARPLGPLRGGERHPDPQREEL